MKEGNGQMRKEAPPVYQKIEGLQTKFGQNNNEDVQTLQSVNLMEL